jgi:hypothetical protein
MLELIEFIVSVSYRKRRSYLVRKGFFASVFELALCGHICPFSNTQLVDFYSHDMY